MITYILSIVLFFIGLLLMFTDKEFAQSDFSGSVKCYISVLLIVAGFCFLCYLVQEAYDELDAAKQLMYEH